MIQDLQAAVRTSLVKSGLLAAYAEYDAAVSRFVFDNLARVGFKEIQRPPSTLTRGLPLIDSPTPLVTAILAYLAIVLVGSLRISRRPKAAANAPDPWWLTLLVQLHNLFLIGLSGYMSASAIQYAWQGGYKLWGNAYRPSEVDMGRTIYIFYVSKLYEFMDTFIMLLKGKLQQISLLHVYHHASISSIWWTIAYVAPGGDAWYSCALNSFVHVLMYTYYLLAVLFGKDEKAKMKYLWWGRYLTQFQMMQFVSMMAQAGWCYYFSPYPKFLSKLLFFYMITLLVLFMDFYIRKHGKGGAAKNGRARASKKAS